MKKGLKKFDFVAKTQFLNVCRDSGTENLPENVAN